MAEASRAPQPPSPWQRWLPGLALLRSYPRAWLGHDLLAGLVLTSMLVPVGIAFSLASVGVLWTTLLLGARASLRAPATEPAPELVHA